QFDGWAEVGGAHPTCVEIGTSLGLRNWFLVLRRRGARWVRFAERSHCAGRKWRFEAGNGDGRALSRPSDFTRRAILKHLLHHQNAVLQITTEGDVRGLPGGL